MQIPDDLKELFLGLDAYIAERYVDETADEAVCENAAFYEEEAADRICCDLEAPSAAPLRKERKNGKKFAGLLHAKEAVSFETAAMKRPDSLDDRVKHLGDTWQETLLKLIDDRGYTDTEVYKRANVDRKLFSKIRSNPAYQPKKVTAVAFAIALKLSLDDTKDFIGRAGYAFSPSSKFDLIIEYFIENEVYDPYTINLALFEHDQQTIIET